jgi:hypothetical protein
MFKWNCDYDTAYKHVREQRPIARPNVGFMCQLLAWHKRLQSGVTSPRLYAIRIQSSYTPNYLVAKATQAPRAVDLDSSTCFVLQTPTIVYVWKGKQSTPEQLQAAQRHAHRLVKYEHAKEIVEFSQGEEPEDFWAATTDGQAAFIAKYSQKTSAAPGLGLKLGLNGIGGGGAITTHSDAHRAPLHDNEDDEESEDDEEDVSDLEPRMFAFPEWIEVEMFDSDDLLDDGVFVVVSNPAKEDGFRFAYVWIGDDVEDVDDDKALELARECLDSARLTGYDELAVAHQGSEPKRFWALFSNG